MEILDNPNVIAERDPDDALGVISGAADQLTWEAKFENFESDGFVPDNIVLAGMGGSALGGLIAREWLDLAIPFEIVRDYTLPRFVGANTLVIAVSVSGNTEETLAALSEAKLRQSHIAIIASGGKLLELARENGLPFVELAKISQPRYGVFMHLRAITRILGTFGVKTAHYDEISTLHDTVAEYVATLTPDRETADNPAKSLAIECAGKTPVISASSQFAPVAYKWKISFNENAKNVAFNNTYPEFNHNEFIGWSSHPIEKPFAIIDLLSVFDNPRIDLRFKISDRLLSGRRPAAHHVKLHGDTVLCQMICGSIMADFTSIYLAILNNVNPTPVELVEKLKTELG